MSKLLALLAVGFFAVAGCASVPKSTAGRDRLKSDSRVALNEMTARDQNLHDILASSAGYVVFPSVAKGGFIVGGAGGEGVLYEHGSPVGYAELSQASIGALAGGQTFAELVVFRDENALQQARSGKIDLTGQASAVIIKSGASADTQFKKGVAVFVWPKGGAMFDVSLAGQQIRVTM